MICGPTGTGKTVNIINKISKICKEDDSFTNLITSFSGQTTAN
jgi:dynein heavy chain